MTRLERWIIFGGALATVVLAVWLSGGFDRQVQPQHPRAVYSAHEPRSSHWPAVRKAHLEAEPRCVFCGSTADLQVHHIQPYHTHPELELEPSNLITLCGPKGNNCHFLFGHLGGYERWNPDVRHDAARYRREVQEAKTRANGLK